MSLLDSFGLIALHFDGRFRADNRTFTAARAIAVDRTRRIIALGVGFLTSSYAALGTDRNTQATALALLSINSYLTSHVSYLS